MSLPTEAQAPNAPQPDVTPSQRHLRRILVAASITMLVGLSIYVANRLFYPYELEWMEGAMVDHSIRVRQGPGQALILGHILHNSKNARSSAIGADLAYIGTLPIDADRLRLVFATLVDHCR